MTELCIVNGRVYDPANGINGEVREICIAGGKIVAEVGPGARRIDAAGMVVMPGGVDIHAHIAGPKVNLARKLQPEDHRFDVHPRTPWTRSGVGGSVPSTFATGYRYAGMGYTTVMEAAVPPLGARHAHEELEDTPVIDKGFYVLMGNNHLAMQLIAQGDRQRLYDYVAWLLNAAKGYTIKVVNPGGVEVWKDRRGNVTDLDEQVVNFGVTPRQILEALTDAGNALGLPHPVHIHCNNLGIAGNYKTTLETLRTLEDRRAHLTHIQFHCYGGKLGGKPTSKAAQIAEYLNSHPTITADVGQVMFGKTTTMTADAPLEYMLHRLSGKKWANADVEMESGCGIVPFEYKDTNYVHALQWGIGLEMFLLCEDPWRLVLSTDHPNGGSFLSYPRLIRLLMDRTFRDDEIKRVNRKAMQKTTLLDGLAREYTLSEIAIITRAGPARMLGLVHKGQLGVGADADITVYDEHEDKEQMFATPRYVLKDGVLIIEEGQLRADHGGRTLHVAPAYDQAIEQIIRPFFDQYYTIRFENYAVSMDYLPHHELIECQNSMNINGTAIEDTFAEAFEMWAARILITAASSRWASIAAQSLTGFATSIIGCKCEAGIERELTPDETPDGRPGISVLLFTPNKQSIANRLIERIGQCVLTCPTTACYNGLPTGDLVDVGGNLRYFGDGYQSSKLLDGRRYWRIPVMEGEFLLEERFGVQRAVGGGTLIIMGEDAATTLDATSAAVAAIRALTGVIAPFPGGISRSGSKTGSRYKFLFAATNDAFCPTLRGVAPHSLVPEGINSVLEIVIDGLDLAAVEAAMRAGMRAAAQPGIGRISAGNYGGTLGQYQIRLHDLV